MSAASYTVAVGLNTAKSDKRFEPGDTVTADDLEVSNAALERLVDAGIITIGEVDG